MAAWKRSPAGRTHPVRVGVGLGHEHPAASRATAGADTVTGARGAPPTERHPRPLHEAPRGGRARDHLVLLARPSESEPSDAHPYQSESDRVLAESHRYRLAVTREARRRLRAPARAGGSGRE